MNRNQLIAGGIVLALLLLLVPGSILLRNEWQNRQAGVYQREPVPGFGYCTAEEIAPCILSFSRDAEGKMLVNILTDRSLPNFYLKIKHSQGQNVYPCHKVEGFSTSVYCTGKALSLGEVFQFFILSTNGDRTLAQGNFSIIGMALSTIQIFTSPMPGTPGTTVASFPTEGSVTTTPPFGRATPTATPTSGSYPNPVPSTTSYPNPNSKSP